MCMWECHCGAAYTHGSAAHMSEVHVCVDMLCVCLQHRAAFTAIKLLHYKQTNPQLLWLYWISLGNCLGGIMTAYPFQGFVSNSWGKNVRKIQLLFCIHYFSEYIYNAVRSNNFCKKIKTKKKRESDHIEKYGI